MKKYNTNIRLHSKDRASILLSTISSNNVFIRRAVNTANVIYIMVKILAIMGVMDIESDFIQWCDILSHILNLTFHNCV